MSAWRLNLVTCNMLTHYYPEKRKLAQRRQDAKNDWTWDNRWSLGALAAWRENELFLNNTLHIMCYFACTLTSHSLCDVLSAIHFFKTSWFRIVLSRISTTLFRPLRSDLRHGNKKAHLFHKMGFSLCWRERRDSNSRPSRLMGGTL